MLYAFFWVIPRRLNLNAGGITQMLAYNMICVSILASITAYPAFKSQLMRRITLQTMSCLAVPYFPTLSYKEQDFQKKKLAEYEMWFLIFSAAFV
jgi:hypothetical protein